VPFILVIHYVCRLCFFPGDGFEWPCTIFTLVITSWKYGLISLNRSIILRHTRVSFVQSSCSWTGRAYSAVMAENADVSNVFGRQTSPITSGARSL
jgi:hypothetical protein